MLDLLLEKVVREGAGTVAPEDKVSSPKKLQLLCSLHKKGLSDISI